VIARTWHGRVPAAKGAAYLAFLERVALPDYKGTPGNRGVQILMRTEADVTHFLLVTFWDSFDAIRAFAGDEVARARYYPEDKDFLLEFEPFVTHYDVPASSDLPHGG